MSPVSRGRLDITKSIVILVAAFMGDCHGMLALTALVEKMEIIETFCSFLRYLEQNGEILSYIY